MHPLNLSELPRIKLAHKKAVLNKKQEFIFTDENGHKHEFETKFAKYMVEALENVKKALERREEDNED